MGEIQTIYAIKYEKSANFPFHTIKSQTKLHYIFLFFFLFASAGVMVFSRGILSHTQQLVVTKTDAEKQKIIAKKLVRL